VVGDQALLAPDERAQLTDPPIAVGELGEEAPAQRVCREAEELRWRRLGVSHGGCDTIHQYSLMSFTDGLLDTSGKIWSNGLVK
jgi:hypothetical protein